MKAEPRGAEGSKAAASAGRRSGSRSGLGAVGTRERSSAAAEGMGGRYGGSAMERKTVEGDWWVAVREMRREVSGGVVVGKSVWEGRAASQRLILGSAVTDRGLHAQRSSVMIAKNNSETAFYTSMNDTGSDSFRQDPHTPPTAIHRCPYCVPGQHQLLHTRKIGAAGAATRRLRPPRLARSSPQHRGCGARRPGSAARPCGRPAQADTRSSHTRSRGRPF